VEKGGWIGDVIWTEFPSRVYRIFAEKPLGKQEGPRRECILGKALRRCEFGFVV